MHRKEQTLQMTGFLGAVAAAVGLAASPAAAISFTPLGDLVGGDTSSSAYAISSDGTTVVGSSSAALDFEAFRWTTTVPVMVSLGDLATGGFESVAYAVSGNGSVAAGFGTTSTGIEAASWSSPLNIPTGLGTLGGANPTSIANGISANGTVIV